MQESIRNAKFKIIYYKLEIFPASGIGAFSNDLKYIVGDAYDLEIWEN